MLNAGSSQPEGGKPKGVLVGGPQYIGWAANSEY